MPSKNKKQDKNGFIPIDRHSTEDKQTAAYLMCSHLFELSMLCKEMGWHRTGLLICVASDELEQMLGNGHVTQKKPYSIAND